MHSILAPGYRKSKTGSSAIDMCGAVPEQIAPIPTTAPILFPCKNARPMPMANTRPKTGRIAAPGTNTPLNPKNALQSKCASTRGHPESGRTDEMPRGDSSNGGLRSETTAPVMGDDLSSAKTPDMPA